MKSEQLWQKVGLVRVTLFKQWPEGSGRLYGRGPDSAMSWLGRPGLTQPPTAEQQTSCPGRRARTQSGCEYRAFAGLLPSFRSPEPAESALGKWPWTSPGNGFQQPVEASRHTADFLERQKIVE